MLNSGVKWVNIPLVDTTRKPNALVFTGTYEHTIDGKNRLAIPAELRAQLKEESDGSNVFLYVTLGEGQAMCLYTQRRFEQRADELDHSELDPDQLLSYERLMFSLARRVEVDKQGRIRLPDNLLKMAKLEPEVVLIGVKDHMEIRDRESWQAHVKQMLDLQPQILMNPRRAMGRPTPPRAPK